MVGVEAWEYVRGSAGVLCRIEGSVLHGMGQVGREYLVCGEYLVCREYLVYV